MNDGDERVQVFKVTRADGFDFHSGTVLYEVGATLEVPDAPADGRACGPGLHFARSLRETCRFGDRGSRPWTWWSGWALKSDLLGHDTEKMRFRRATITAAHSITDVFGPDFAQRIAAAHTEIGTWKSIPWCGPSREITDADIAPLLARWHDAIAPWHAKRGSSVELPRKAVIVRSSAAAAADAAAAAAADAADAAEAADAAAAADAADAADADADADAAAAAAADADAADADAADAAAWYRWRRWYTRPRYVLWRAVRWSIAMDGPNPWAPLIEIYKLGCIPIGYSAVNGEVVFVVYAPPVRP